jgi:hypothetical protein
LNIVLSDRNVCLKKKHYCLSSKMVVPLRKIIDYSEVHCYQRVRCFWMWLSMFIKRRYLKESVSVIFKLIWKHKKNVLQQWMLIKITWIMNGIFSNIPCQNIDWFHAELTLWNGHLSYCHHIASDVVFHTSSH